MSTYKQAEVVSVSKEDKFDFTALLKHSFEKTKAILYCDEELSPKHFLAENVFNFTTYSNSMSELFVKKALEVCAAITDKTTFDYIKDEDNYQWFLIMCNMPFFVKKLDWGSSIRGAWWSAEKAVIGLDAGCCGIWIGDEQVTVKFDSTDAFEDFIKAVIAFAACETN